MPVVSYVQMADFIRYDGTNGAAVASYLGHHVISDNGSVLALAYSPNLTDPSYTFQLGDAFGSAEGFFPSDQFLHRYALPSTFATPADGVGTMDGVSVTVPLLLLGGSVDRVVTWNRAFPDTSYKVSFMPDANTLGRITAVVKSGTKTASGITVTISAGLAVTVAGVLHVLGTT